MDISDDFSDLDLISIVDSVEEASGSSRSSLYPNNFQSSRNVGTNRVIDQRMTSTTSFSSNMSNSVGTNGNQIGKRGSLESVLEIDDDDDDLYEALVEEVNSSHEIKRVRLTSTSTTTTSSRPPTHRIATTTSASARTQKIRSSTTNSESKKNAPSSDIKSNTSIFRYLKDPQGNPLKVKEKRVKEEMVKSEPLGGSGSIPVAPQQHPDPQKPLNVGQKMRYGRLPVSNLVNEGFPHFDLQNHPVPPLPPFDHNATKTWIFPSNRQKRDYQFEIIKSSLFENTLVTLPTGLGKTFIAAIVMHNFYRWFPLGLIIFMAPTRPLVNQQIRECNQHGGIPSSTSAELVGTTGVKKRRELWKDLRVAYATPHTVKNDLASGALNPSRIVLLVIDEAHRATGNYASVLAVKAIMESNPHVRVLALSATPGSDAEQVQMVINNLCISQLETRNESDTDVSKYIHERTVEEIIIPLSGDLQALCSLFRDIVKRVVYGPLKRNNLIYTDDVDRMKAFYLLSTVQKLRASGSRDFETISSLYLGRTLAAAYESLHKYGVVAFRSALGKAGLLHTDVLERGIQGRLVNSQEWRSMLGCLEGLALYGKEHPKVRKLKEVVGDHFQGFRGDKTRAIVFSTIRESVDNVVEVLSGVKGVKPMKFVGHATAAGATKGLTEVEQKNALKTFRSGGYNTLVATCIAEEGLDIGDVDLIVCFDVQSNPTRMVQRMGRTGRKRSGRVVCLVSEGIEEKHLTTMRSRERAVQRALREKSFRFFVPFSTVLPPNASPQLQFALFQDLQHTSPAKRRPPPFAVGSMISSTKSATSAPAPFPPLEPLSLTSHLAIQSLLSPTHLFPHSNRSKLLVGLVSQIEERDYISIDVNSQSKTLLVGCGMMDGDDDDDDVELEKQVENATKTTTAPPPPPPSSSLTASSISTLSYDDIFALSQSFHHPQPSPAVPPTILRPEQEIENPSHPSPPHSPHSPPSPPPQTTFVEDSFEYSEFSLEPSPPSPSPFVAPILTTPRSSSHPNFPTPPSRPSPSPSPSIGSRARNSTSRKRKRVLKRVVAAVDEDVDEDVVEHKVDDHDCEISKHNNSLLLLKAALESKSKKFNRPSPNTRRRLRTIERDRDSESDADPKSIQIKKSTRRFPQSKTQDSNSPSPSPITRSQLILDDISVDGDTGVDDEFDEDEDDDDEETPQDDEEEEGGDFVSPLSMAAAYRQSLLSQGPNPIFASPPSRGQGVGGVRAFGFKLTRAPLGFREWQGLGKKHSPSPPSPS